MTIAERIRCMEKLGQRIGEKPGSLEFAILKSQRENPWFTEKSIDKALTAISENYLQKKHLTRWLKEYSTDQFPDSPKHRVGVIMPGNIPMVGFHDLLSVYISGSISVVKCSGRDNHLIPWCIRTLCDIDSRNEDYFEYSGNFKDLDALIATGSNNTEKYFIEYFGHLPHIIRKNRSTVAVVDENVTDEELQQIADDFFTYFGLGCRSVSKIFLPKDFDLQQLITAFQHNDHVHDHSKYFNNIEYNLAVSILNKEEIINGGNFLLRKDPSPISRIGVLHYSFYDQPEQIEKYLQQHSEQLQAVISTSPLNGWHTVRPGKAQRPELWDYADNVDTMEFLIDTI